MSLAVAVADPAGRSPEVSPPALSDPVDARAMRQPHCELCEYYAAISLGGYQDHFLCTHPHARTPLLDKDDLHPPPGCPMLRAVRLSGAGEEPASEGGPVHRLTS